MPDTFLNFTTLPRMLASTEGSDLYLAMVAVLVTATLVALAFRRFGLQVIPAYLIAGALIGPHALGMVSDRAVVEQIAAPGVVLLLFSIGLQLELSAMKRGMVSMLSVGVLSTLGFVLLAWPIAWIGGLSAPTALAIAMAMSISSTAVLLRALNERRELHSVHGRLCLGVAIVQDILSVLMLVSLPALGKWAGSGAADAGAATGMDEWPKWIVLLLAMAKSLGGIAVVLAFGRFLLPWILKQVAEAGSKGAVGTGASSELVLVASAALAMLTAVSTAAIGFSPELGAFIAGVMLAATPYRHQLVGQLAPIRDLLMAIFFTAVGLQISAEVIWQHSLVIVLGVGMVMVLKITVIGLTAWLFGSPAPTALITGVYQGNAGEFSLVVLSSAVAAGAIGHEASAGSIVVVVVTLLISPSLFSKSHEWAAKLRSVPLSPLTRSLSRALVAKHGEGRLTTAHATHAGPHADGSTDPNTPPGSPATNGPSMSDSGNAVLNASAANLTGEPDHDGPVMLRDHVILAGFGPIARNMASRLITQGTPFTVIELNPTTVRRQAIIGRSVIYGDVTNPEVLETAGIRHALALVLTIPDEDAMLRACSVARSMNATLFIAGRTGYLSGAFQAQQSGADHVVVEEIATAEAMERQVLSKIAAIREKRANTST